MDNQDQRRTHAQGHESHGGVFVCHKCGWPFPNPHPSAKHRRAHKKICGTIEGYQVSLLASDDDELHLSDEDERKRKPGNNEKDSDDGIGEKSIRPGDEVFSDAVADFLDGDLNPGVKEHLQDSLGSATDMEVICRKYPELLESSAGNGSNVADETRLIVGSRNYDQMQNPEASHSEGFDGDMLELQGQLLSSTDNALESSNENLENRELIVLHSNGHFGCDFKPSECEAIQDAMLENARGGSLTSISKETTLEERPESNRDFVEIVVSSKGEMCEGVSQTEVTNVDSSDYQVVDGASKPKEKNVADFPSVMPRVDFPPEANCAVSTNASAHMIEFATSSDVKVLQEREEGNVNVFTIPAGGDGPDVLHSLSEYEDSEGMKSRNSSSQCSSKELLQERDDLKDSVTKEIDSLINQCQLSEKGEFLCEDEDMHALNSYMKLEQVKSEFIAEQIHTEESIKDLPGRASNNAMKKEINEGHIVRFSEQQWYYDVPKNSRHISSSTGSFMAKSNEKPSDASFGSTTSEETTVISRDDLSHHEENMTRINDIAVDGKCGCTNFGNVTSISITTHQQRSSNSEIKPSSEYLSVDTVELDKSENCGVQNTERSVVKDTTPLTSCNFESQSEVEMDGPATRSKEDCNRFAGTTAETLRTKDEELLLKATEGIVRDHSSNPFLSIKPFPQHASAVEVTGDEGPEGTQSGTALSVQSEAQAANEAEAIPSTDLQPSIIKEEKSNLKGSEAASSGSQQCETREMFEPPSFMTLVEPGHVVGPKPVAGSKPVASEDQKESNKEHLNSPSSHAGWFPTLTHVTNESQGRKRNEAIIAKVTKRSTMKEQHASLKSLLGEAATHNSKPKSPKPEKNPANQKNGKEPEERLTTLNSILAPESPPPAATQAVTGEGAKERNSPVKHLADSKKEKKKRKSSKPFWIPFVCCSSVDIW